MEEEQNALLAASLLRINTNRGVNPGSWRLSSNERARKNVKIGQKRDGE